MIKVEMNNKIKEYREKRKLSQEQISNITGISRSLLSKIENGKVLDIKLSTLCKIADALRIDVKKLID